MEPLTLIVTTWGFLFGALAGWLALGRDRRVAPWVIYGVLLGPIALAILQVAPPGRCPHCGGTTVGWESACLHCDRPFGGRRSRTTVPEVLPAERAARPIAPVAGVTAPRIGGWRDRPARAPGPVRMAQPATGVMAQPAEPAGPIVPAERAPAGGDARATAEDAPAAADPVIEAAAPAQPPARAARSRASRMAPEPASARTTPPAVAAARPGRAADTERGRESTTAKAATRRRAAMEPAGDSPAAGSAWRNPARPATAPMPTPAPEPAETRGVELPSTAAVTPSARLGVAFITGSVPLEIGNRYLLTFEHGRFQVLGPLESSPTRVRVDRWVDELDITVVNNQLLLEATREPQLALGFNVIRGEDVGRFERAFDAASRSGADA